MGPAHITPGWFTLDKDIAVGEDGTVTVEPGAAEAAHRRLTTPLNKALCADRSPP